MRPGTAISATIHGRLPGRLEQIRYHRTADHPGNYKHDFTTPTDIFALEDGGLLIRPRTSAGGLMGTPKLWLDNPRHHKHHGRRHRHNPYLAAYNPHAMALLKAYASAHYATAALSGAAGFGATYLGYKALFSLTTLASYGADPGWSGILVRTVGRGLVAVAGDLALARFMGGHHNRVAYIAGAAAYVGLSGALEATGYQVTVGAPGGAPLVTLLPASLAPGATVAGDLSGTDGLDAIIRRTPGRPRGGRVAGELGLGAFINSRGLGLHPSRMYQNRLTPA
jgi:hypothetical protein